MAYFMQSSTLCEADETKILIEAKKQYCLGKLEQRETFWAQLKKARSDWKEMETKILVAAKAQDYLEKLESRETFGAELKKFNINWKKIETICKQRGVERSAEQCRTRWRRLRLTYLQIKFWEQEKTPEMSSYWSMSVDERKATGVLLFHLDQSIYNLLDALYNNSADALKEGFIEDAGEVTEFKKMLPGQGMQSPLKEKSQVRGITDASHLSASEDDSHECHRKSSQFSSTEVKANQKQVEWIAGATASVGESARENGCSSSSGLEVSYEMQSAKLAGAASSVENVLQDQRHNSQVAGITAPATQIHEVLRASVASEEGNVSEEQPGEQVSGSAAFAPITEEYGSIDKNVTLKINLEAGDTTNESVLSVSSEETHEKQRGRVAGTVASLQETHQCKNAQTHQIDTELSTSKEKICEGHRATSQPVFTAVEIFNETQNEQAAGEEILKSTNVASNIVGGVKEKTFKDIHASPSLEVQGMDTVLNHSIGQSSEPVLGGHLCRENDKGLPNKEIASTRAEVFSTTQIEQITGSEVSNILPVAINTTAIAEERRSKDSCSLPSNCQGMVIALEGNTMHSSRANLAELTHSSNGEGLLNQETNYTGSEVFRIAESEQVSGSEESKNNPVTDNTINGGQEKMLEGSHSLSYHEFQAVDMPHEENPRNRLKETVIGQSPSGNDVGSLNEEPEYNGAERCGLSQPAQGTNDGLSSIKEDDGCADMVVKRTSATEERTAGMGFGESGEAKGAETLERPATDSPETEEKGSVKEKGLQLYDGWKHNDDFLMYVPAAIGNVIRAFWASHHCCPSLPICHRVGALHWFIDYVTLVR
ncbi:hypothetical protein GOP47_0012418 [Adiantum capillus-veneris]|uniref:Myb-like domain-containing protein n=1 Tax=Adiantum capillus-veneris TaxID=13818 RepID=A0A9D4URQ3_ADICA|nr:hypothetical protein GOP47_0012418 [Adiantum capillus-veneris]